MRKFSKITLCFPSLLTAILIVFNVSFISAQIISPATNQQYERLLCVKFNNDLPVYAENGRLTDHGSGVLTPLGDALSAGIFQRMIQLDESVLDEMREQARKYWDEVARLDSSIHPGVIADMNCYFILQLYPETDKDALIRKLNESNLIESVTELAAPVDAPLPGNYVANQTYLGSSNGINANQVYTTYNNRGQNVKVVDIERGFNPNHADLPTVQLVTGTYMMSNVPLADMNHGTAVLGQMVSKDNGWGTTGISSSSTALFAGAYDVSGTYNIANAILQAANATQAGDVILIEQQIGGPYYVNNNNGIQDGLVPVEYEKVNWDAVKIAVGNNRIVVEAAGNGKQNLDDPANQKGNLNHYPFHPNNHSGAIMVGAGFSVTTGSSVARSRIDFSNYGSRLDVQGHGEKIWTTGYGLYYSAEGPNYSYTNQFGGTSGASPIVAGACLLVQSMCKSSLNAYLTPHQIRTLLINTGTPQQAGTFPVSQKIGPLPNAFSAIQSMLGSGSSSCNAPGSTQLSTSNLTTSSVRLNCSVTGVQAYDWRYRQSGASSWTDLPAGSPAYYDVSGLSANTTYEFSAAVKCNSSTSSTWSSPKSFTTSSVSTCNAPTVSQLAATNTGTSSVRLNCSVSGVLAYDWRYRKVGASSWTDLPAGSPAYYDVSGLSANTTYEFSAAVKCNSSTWSTWSSPKSFTTSASLSNDNPCNAILLSAGNSCSYTNGNTTGATSTNNDQICNTSSPKDVWYSCAIPGSGKVTFRTAAGTLDDAVMGVYYGSCNNLTPIICEDDNSNGNGSNMPVIAISGQPGTMLYIRVWGYQNMSGTFGICAMNYTSTNLTDTDTGAFYTIPDETGNQSAERDLLSTTDLALAIPFPNPTSGILTIPVTSTETSDVRISVMDEMGRLVLSSPLTEADVNHQLQINIASLTNGFYIVKVNTVSGSVSHKIQLLR